MDENSTRKLLIAGTRDLGIRIIIATEKGNVKFEGVDENSTRKLRIAETRDLGIRIIIATEKGNVKFEEEDERSAGQLLAESYRGPRRRVSSLQANRM